MTMTEQDEQVALRQALLDEATARRDAETQRLNDEVEMRQKELDDAQAGVFLTQTESSPPPTPATVGEVNVDSDEQHPQPLQVHQESKDQPITEIGQEAPPEPQVVEEVADAAPPVEG